ncbi:putrescine ABC transporter ATP-binding subunit PotG [Celerinatantimonas sp. YJH-8]|uniref:putrescine ABC transporter ATP-binding subunit PotG n=1 Tax=Celerinatantimonas sp. YJH-8 TaxID=3228714 RepID=UPI0038C77969
MEATPSTATPPLLQIKNLSKTFDGVHAVDDVDLEIRRGELFALLGASGCGKSTLLRMLAGFEQPSKGQIILDGVDLAEIPPHRRPVNMMFQSYALFPHMTVAGNIAFGLKQDGLKRQEVDAIVAQMLKLVRMEEYAKRKPHQLSGGQRQRVALARSLAKKPKLLLLDEPMGALDKKLREQMQLEVVDILESVGVTCVMVTHDQEEAMTMATRIAIMDRGQFIQIGSPEEIYEYPNSRYSAEFIGSMNIFEGELIENQADQAVIHCHAFEQPILLNHGLSDAPGLPLMVALRPEKIKVFRKLNRKVNVCTGEVEDIAYLGGQSIYHVRLPSGQLVRSTLPNSSRHRNSLPTWKETVHLCWEADSCVVLKI